MAASAPGYRDPKLRGAPLTCFLSLAARPAQQILLVKSRRGSCEATPPEEQEQKQTAISRGKTATATQQHPSLLTLVKTALPDSKNVDRSSTPEVSG